MGKINKTNTKRHISRKIKNKVDGILESFNKATKKSLTFENKSSKQIFNNQIVQNIISLNVPFSVGSAPTRQSSLISEDNTQPFQYHRSEGPTKEVKEEAINFEKSENNETEEKENTNFINNLGSWACKHNICHNAINELLNILRYKYFSLPKDARSLLKTPRKLDITRLNNGEMSYFGIENGIKSKLADNIIPDIKNIYIQINIDGLPLFKSSSKECYPILARCENLSNSSPFAIAVYCGIGKPDPLCTFLEKFLKEMAYIYEQGIIYETKKYTVQIKLFTCDAPARSYLKNIVSHTSKNACEKCKQLGIWQSNRIIFEPLEINELRKDNDFINEIDDPHIKGQSPLLSIGVKLVTQFPLDPMHLVFLGVMRRLLVNFWVEGKPPGKLSRQMINMISCKLLALKTHVTKEFVRKPRSLTELKRWKATEYRFFCLYAGIIVLKNIVSKEIYDNFICFHSAIFILSNKNLINQYTDIARKSIFDFIKNSKFIYGSSFIVYNVHSLQHLTDDVQKFGPIDSYSCFPFENHLGRVKKMLRTKSYPLQQICNRLIEIEKSYCRTQNNQNESRHINQDSVNDTVKSIVIKNFTVSIYFPNNCVSTIGGKVFTVSKIIKTDLGEKLLGYTFRHQNDFYNIPVQSSKLGIYFVDCRKENTTSLFVNEIKNKIMLLPHKKGFVALPILHTL